ncbi:MAG: hypothetical protein NTW50_03435 [Candidatus Berkelbacteria bacterium]|nr:hypothetical protein [Candidatus Berkelbacteria bacterium]
MYVRVDDVVYDLKKESELKVGGEGTVSMLSNTMAVKIYHDYNEEMEAKLTECLDYNVYASVEVASLTNSGYCVANQIDLRRTASLFCHLHDAIAQIHSGPFCIGDLRAANIMFKPSTSGPWDIAIMDVDSWEVYITDISQDRWGCEVDNSRYHYCTAIHDDVVHPDLINTNYSQLMKYHDWYAFAHQLATCLLKCNPFEEGRVAGMTDIERKIKGISCFCGSLGGVALTLEEQINIKRLGSDMTGLLQRWLTGKEKGVFPRSAILDFIQGLCVCRSCGLQHFERQPGETHCVRCGNRLVLRW